MSIANLLTDGEKMYQNLDINNLICNNADITNLDANNVIVDNTDVDNLFVKNINVSLPNTEININNGINLNNNDITNVGTLQAINIIGNITDEDISVNTISSATTGFVTFGDPIDMDFDNIINIGTASFGVTPVNDNAQTRLLVTDNVSGEIKYRSVSSLPVVNPFDQNLNSSDTVIFGAINMNGSISMNANDIISINQIFSNTISDVTGGTGNISCLSGFNMLNNDILDVKDIRFQTISNDDTENKFLVLNNFDNVVEYRNYSSLGIPNQSCDINSSPIFSAPILTGIVNDNTESKLLVLDGGTNEIQYRTVASLPATNPFNQSLNTSNSPSFSGLTLNGNLDMTNDNIDNINTLTTNNAKISTISGSTSGTVATIASDSSSYVVDGSCLFAIQREMSLTQIASPGTPGGFTGILYNKTGGDLCFKNTNGFEYVINDYFGKYQAYEESTSLSTSADTVNWLTKVSIPSTSFAAGDYIVEYSCVMSNSNRENATAVRLLQDGVNVSAHNIYHARPPVNNYLVTVNQFYKRTLTAGNHTFALEMRPESTTGSIAEARIFVYRSA